MSLIDSLSAPTKIGSRLSRLPVVVLVTVCLLFSLFYCATCDLDFADVENGSTVVSMDRNSPPHTPEQLPPCHHCLSHVTAQQLGVFAEPADLIPAAPSYLREQFSASSSGLLPFKPPRG